MSRDLTLPNKCSFLTGKAKFKLLLTQLLLYGSDIPETLPKHHYYLRCLHGLERYWRVTYWGRLCWSFHRSSYNVNTSIAKRSTFQSQLLIEMRNILTLSKRYTNPQTPRFEHRIAFVISISSANWAIKHG
jgi:hypothetical protein